VQTTNQILFKCLYHASISYISCYLILYSTNFSLNLFNLKVSLSTDDPSTSTTLLFDSQDRLYQGRMSGDTTALSSPGADPRPGSYSPIPTTRRGNSEKDTRRMSLAQRKQSSTQVSKLIIL
jgi:hypothetical protein